MYPSDQSHPNAGYPGPAQPHTGPYANLGGYNPPVAAQHHAAGQSPAVYQGHSTAELASWGQRAGAYVIDYLVQMVIAAAVIASTIGLAFITWEAVDPAGAGGHDPPAVFIVLMLLAYPATFAAMFCYRWLPHAKSGQTMGKRVMGIRLVKEATGQPVGKGASAGRELVYFALSAMTCIGVFLDLLWPLWDDKNQTLHDKVVGGIVVHA